MLVQQQRKGGNVSDINKEEPFMMNEVRNIKNSEEKK